MMNIKKIQELVEIMNNNDLAEIDIEQEGSKVRLIRGVHGAVHQQVHLPSPVPVQSPVQATQEQPKEDARKLLEVKAPMVGTFYRASSPDSDPYVQIGDIVHKGDVLCIIEAMKLMNEVKSEFNGKIVDILAENAEPVEFGQTVFLIEPA